MKPYQKRVVEEKKALDEKISRLVEFFNTPMCLETSEPELSRLDEQLTHMNKYSAVLGARIRAFDV